MSQKVVAQGGKGGKVWNDGIFEGVKKVSVGRDDYCVTFVKFKYVKGSTFESREHGVINQRPQEFVINYPKEYITSVEGTYAHPYWKVITSLTFKTSEGRISPTFGNTKFVLKNNGQMLVGFHGRSKNTLEALGAYFSSEYSPPLRLEAQGGPDGDGGIWDDGAYNDVRKIYIGMDTTCVTRVKFDYVRAGIPYTQSYGIAKEEELQEFLLDDDEYIVSVEGTYGKVHRVGRIVITSLSFTTSKGRTSLTFGATKFVLEDNGRELVGFHGRSNAALDAIGAYFARASSSHNSAGSNTILMRYKTEMQGERSCGSLLE